MKTTKTKTTKTTNFNILAVALGLILLAVTPPLSAVAPAGILLRKVVHVGVKSLDSGLTSKPMPGALALKEAAQENLKTIDELINSKNLPEGAAAEGQLARDAWTPEELAALEMKKAELNLFLKNFGDAEVAAQKVLQLNPEMENAKRVLKMAQSNRASILIRKGQLHSPSIALGALMGLGIVEAGESLQWWDFDMWGEVEDLQLLGD